MTAFIVFVIVILIPIILKLYKAKIDKDINDGVRGFNKKIIEDMQKKIDDNYKKRNKE